MADIPQYAWAIDQAGPKLTAAILRGQHHDATSGGTGVGSPRALKVVPQAAPDNTVLILPGGGTAKSTYPGHENQSYQGTNFKPQTLEIPPTGSSSGGRTDLIIQRFLDPNEETHPDYDGEYPIPAEVAKTLWQWRIECKTGMDRTATFEYPHVQLAEIVRPANTTIVDDSHIIDLRELADPKKDQHIRANNMNAGDSQSLHTGSTVWPTNATHTVKIPDFATRIQAIVNWGNIRAEVTNPISALVRLFIIHPDGTEISTQESRFRTVAGVANERFGVVLGDNINVPEKFRGQNCRVELRGTKLSGPNLYMDGNSSWSLQLFFEQEIA